MSNKPPGDDEPTRSYRPFGDDAESEPTRVERSVGHEGGNDEPTAYMGTPAQYDYQQPAQAPTDEPDGQKKGWRKAIGPFFAAAVFVFIGGLVVGWLLFNGDGASEDEETTTTEVTPTTAPATTEAPRRTTTTQRATTTTEEERTTTTARQTTTTTSQP